jgi:hypothetical protein
LKVTGADHAAISNDAKLLDIEALPHPFAYRHEGFDIGGVAGPHLAADRPALIVNDDTNDHLLEIWPMIFTESPFAEALAALTLKVDRSGVEKHQLKLAEQIPPHFEQVFFNQILIAPGRKIRGAGLIRQRFSQKGHGAVKMVQLKLIGTANGVISSPAIAVPVGAGCHESMQHGEKQSPLDIELEFTTVQQSLQRLFDAGLRPQSLENQSWADFHCDSIGLAVAGQYQYGFFRISGKGSDQRLHAPLFLEMIQAADSGNDPLLDPAFDFVVFNDLQVLILAGLF